MFILANLVVLYLVASANCLQSDLHMMHICRKYLHGSEYLIPSVDFSLELVNNKTNLLSNYNFKATHSVISLDVGSAVKAFIEQLSHPPHKVMVLGPTYTDQASIIAETAPKYGLVEMSYSVTSSMLSNPRQYPYFLRSIESTQLHNPVIYKILRYFNWTKVATISKDTEIVLSTISDMHRILKAGNVSILAATTFKDNARPQLKQVKDSGARIILAFYTGSRTNPRTLCQAYKEGLYGENYQWIIWSGMFGTILPGTSRRDDCTAEQMSKVTEGAIYFLPVTSVKDSEDDNKPALSNLTKGEVKALYKEYLLSQNLSSSYELSLYAVDAVWAAATGLNASIQHRPEDHQYGDIKFSQHLYQALKKVKFNGMTGQVMFNDVGDRINDVAVFQMTGGRRRLIAKYNTEKNLLQKVPGQDFIFPGGHPPYDSIQTVHVLTEVSSSLYIGMCSLAGLGLLLCLVCLVFNIYHRHTRLIKLSSPRINSLIAMGCALSYVAIFFIGLNGSSAGSWLCSVRVWMLAAGYTFAFGSMFSKTWRVHILFTNKKMTRKVVKDGHLLLLVVVFFSIDMILLTVWQIVDPPGWTTILLPSQAANAAVLYQPVVLSCTSLYGLYWMGCLYAVKSLLLIFGIFFAWETRLVKIEALNDSKQIGLCVYNVMIMSVVCVPLVHLLSYEQVDISYGVVATCILVCSTTALALVFGTKMYLMIFRSNQVEAMTKTPFAAGSRTRNEDRSATQSQTEPRSVMTVTGHGSNQEQ